MKHSGLLYSILLPGLLILACQKPAYSPDEDLYDPSYLHNSVQKLTDVIVHDIVSPPVASRMYVYPFITVYEVLAKGNENYSSYAGQLNGFNGVSDPPADEEICLPCAAYKAFFDVSKYLVFSEQMIDSYEKSTMNELRSHGIPDDIFLVSLAYGEKVAQEIISWAKKDGYDDSRKMAQYSPASGPGRWKPTPPDFMDAIEPNWNTLRPFVLNKSDQFVPEAPPEFSMDESSAFYKEVLIVYNAIADSNAENEEIARFWDCNPFDIEHKGHLMLGVKKITPGGHWVGISSQACKQAELNIMESAEVYSMLGITLADAFISCWDEKYRSDLIRPETVINTYMDPNWKPILTTPPFPEHTSGHSVVSAASAITLTHLFGDNFSFTDSVEVKYGLPERSFSSFYNAAEEAAISRLYGGIHYMPAITEGVKQGKQVGSFIIDNIQTRTKDDAQ